MNLSEKQLLAIKYSLAFLWLFTGFISLTYGKDIGLEVLANRNIVGTNAEILVYLGSGIDLLIGVWLLTDKWQKACCMSQIVVIVTFTILLTWFDYRFWLHPFGPVTKNLPILVLVWLYFHSLSGKVQMEKK